MLTVIFNQILYLAMFCFSGWEEEVWQGKWKILFHPREALKFVSKEERVSFARRKHKTHSYRVSHLLRDHNNKLLSKHAVFCQYKIAVFSCSLTCCEYKFLSRINMTLIRHCSARPTLCMSSTALCLLMTTTELHCYNKNVTFIRSLWNIWKSDN